MVLRPAQTALSDKGFDWSAYFLGDIYTGKQPAVPKPKASKVKYRAREGEACPTMRCLWTWRSAAHKADPLRSVRPATFIIDDVQIKLLSRVLPGRIRIPSDVTRISSARQGSGQLAGPSLYLTSFIDLTTLHLQGSPSPTVSNRSRARHLSPARSRKGNVSDFHLHN